MTKTKSSLSKTDTWSYVHCLGCFGLTASSWRLGIPAGWVWVLILAVLWELLDLIALYHPDWLPKGLLRWLDVRGFSWMDIVWDAGGIAGAWVIFYSSIF